jgi:carboxy-cis,cis-muconate cyclase
VNALHATSPLYHVISGSFGSLSLFLLAFSPINRTLSLLEQVPGALGPHQYLAKNIQGDRVYATSEAWPPTLNSWSVEKSNDHPWTLEHINTVPISMYIILWEIPLILLTHFI